MMGDDGLRKATEVALLNANYMKARLQDHYEILYANKNGMCAHEFIIDCRPFSEYDTHYWLLTLGNLELKESTLQRDFMY